MKKLLLLFLAIVTGMVNANAQRTESGKIKVYFCDPTGKWEASHFYIYVFGTSTNHNDNWPGEDVTNNTIDYDGKTWYYREFDTETYGEGFKVIFVNNSGTEGQGQSQSVDITWDLKGNNGIYNDSYYILQDKWTGDKREAADQVTYYMCKTDDSSVTRLDKDGTTYSTTIEMQGNNNPQYYVVLNPYGFKNYNQIDWGQKNNIYRPSTDAEIMYLNSTDVTVNRNENDGSWKFQAPVNYNFSIVIDNWDSKTYSIEPFINKTITDAGYATIASEGMLNLANIEGGLVGQIGTMSGNTVNFTDVNDVPANTGVLLKGAAGEYKIGFVNESSTAVSNNVLVGVTEATQIGAATTDGKTNFVLMNGNSGVGFYKVSDDGFTVGANTAYLSTAISENAKSFIAVEGGETTGISTIDNGQLTMENVYDLQGRKVMNPTKGLYIVNGKKVVLK